MTARTTTEKAESIAKLRDYVQPGAIVYTILRHQARSGMSRHISVLVNTADGDSPYEISWLVGRALGYRRNLDDGGLIVSGCGMDMGFSVVYNLGRTLWPDGYGCTGAGVDQGQPRCRSNDHSNGDRDYTPWTPDPEQLGKVDPDHWHKDGGYALTQKWL